MQAFHNLLQQAGPAVTLDQLLSPADSNLLRQVLLFHLAPTASCLRLDINAGVNSEATLDTALPGSSLTIGCVSFLLLLLV